MERALVELGLATFRTLCPRRIVKLDQVTNPLHEENVLLYSKYLEIYVIDSPVTPAPSDIPVVATMIVPKDRERDLMFSSDQGRRRLISKYENVSRLILVMNKTTAGSYYTKKAIKEDEYLSAKLALRSMIRSLQPQVCAGDKDLEEDYFIEYEDELLGIVSVGKTNSAFHGEIRVEGIELASVGGGARDFRRRVTFLNCPDCVQSDMRLCVVPLQTTHNLGLDSLDLSLLKSLEKLGFIRFQVDTSKVIQPEVQGILASLSLASEHLQQKLNKKDKPKALCLGVGSGSLVSFLNKELKFSVVGVERDHNMVLIAEEQLGLVQDEYLGIIIGNAALILPEVVSPEDDKVPKKMFSKIEKLFSRQFDIIVLDVNSGVDRVGTGNSSPTSDFMKQQFFTESKVALCDGGLLIINVDCPSYIFYSQILKFVKKTFNKVYRINMTSKNKFILIGKACSEEAGDDCSTSDEKVDGKEQGDNESLLNLMEKLKASLAVPPMFFDSIYEI